MARATRCRPRSPYGTGYAINDNREVAGMVDDGVAPLQPAIW